MARKPRKYHTLLVRVRGVWSPEFGSFEMDDVRAEYAAFLEAGERRGRDLKIITTGETQAEINACVAELNGDA